MFKSCGGKDLLLLFLYAPGATDQKNEPIYGRTKLTKMVFLFEKELKKDFFNNVDASIFEFTPYLFGPYSRQLLADLDFLVTMGFVEKSDTSIPIANAEKAEDSLTEREDIWEDIWGEIEKKSDERIDAFEQKYTLTEKGIRYVETRLWNSLGEYQVSTLCRFKTQISRITLDDLLRYVYNKYLEYTENSTIKDKYL